MTLDTKQKIVLTVCLSVSAIAACWFVHHRWTTREDAVADREVGRLVDPSLKFAVVVRTLVRNSAFRNYRVLLLCAINNNANKNTPSTEGRNLVK